MLKCDNDIKLNNTIPTKNILIVTSPDMIHGNWDALIRNISDPSYDITKVTSYAAAISYLEIAKPLNHIIVNGCSLNLYSDETESSSLSNRIKTIYSHLNGPDKNHYAAHDFVNNARVKMPNAYITIVLHAKNDIHWASLFEKAGANKILEVPAIELEDIIKNN